MSVLPLYFTWIVIYDKVCLCLHNGIRVLIHACACVCVWGGGGGCLASVSGPMCMFVFVILRDRKKIFLASKDKNKVLKS